jgi:uncharacterized protein with NAD-binding domain and iron-sulfur cluster
VTITGYVKPFDTWSSMTHLLEVEDWPETDGPRTLGYFCNTLPTDTLPPVSEVGHPRREHERVRVNAEAFLEGNVTHYWPGASRNGDGGFDWGLLHGPEGLDGPHRLEAQFWTANVDPSERYVQSLPGTHRVRLRADDSGFEGLVIAGDWIDNGLNAGCIEAAVMSGYQAANVVLGRDRNEGVAGWFPDNANR